MKNPFVYGKEVSKENFCNRENEIKEISRDIENSQNVLIFSQRRFGKTSLIKRVFEELDPKEVIIVYADLYPVITEEDFIRIYSKAISGVITRGMKAKISDLLSVFKRLRPVFSVDPSGQSSFSVDIQDSEIVPFTEDVLEGLNRYVKSKKKKAVVCFDEFQQIGQLKTDRLEKQMRSILQTHEEISYIFMGSKKHLIRDMFNSPNRPFYKSAKSFPLGKISNVELSKFIMGKFKRSGKKISESLIDKIIAECESHPYYVQYLCHTLWENALDKVDISQKDLHESVATMLMRESSTFEAIWDALTQKQKQLLIALSASEGHDKIFSADFLREYGLGSASTVQRTVSTLIDRDLVDKTNDIYSIMDMVFKRWVITQSA